MAENEKIKKAKGINLAVADFTAKNVAASDSSIVSDFLRTELVKLGGFNVVEKANMDKILAEVAFQQTGCTTSECAVQIGKLLNVQQMVVGSLSKLMETYFITVYLVNVETGKILTSYNEEAQSAKELRDACARLADKLTKPFGQEIIPTLPLSPTPSSSPHPREKIKQPEQKTENIEKRIESHHKQAEIFLAARQYRYAIAVYKDAIRIFPNEVTFYAELGALYREQKQLGMAVDAYLACLEKNPDADDVRKDLAVLYEEMEKTVRFSYGKYTDKAKEQWK
ncbi:MAG: CsgG/HfaB family protein, partial [Elusimicrobiota bacterium]